MTIPSVLDETQHDIDLEQQEIEDNEQWGGLSEEKDGEEQNPKQHASSSDERKRRNFLKLKEMHTLG